jgi:tRNA-dihydrouridine synthase
MYPAAAVTAAAERSTEHLRALLGVDSNQQPLAVQLGGRDPVTMAAAAQHCASLGGVDEININVGCPSDTVSVCHCYGAALMKEAAQVQLLAAAVRKAVPSTVAVTVKHRLGVDDVDSWEQLVDFVRVVSAAPANVRHFVVHARKAILGLSTADNREVPPLRHDWVFRLARAFPHLSFELNGEVATLEQAAQLLAQPTEYLADKRNDASTAQARENTSVTSRSGHEAAGLQSVMVGRAAFYTPWMLARVDSMEIFGGQHSKDCPDASDNPATRRQVVVQYANYAESAFETGRARLEEDVRQEMSSEGSIAPSSQTVAHRLKPRLTALREALYLPLMNLFAETPMPGQATESKEQLSAADNAMLTEDETRCSVQWRRRLEKSLGKRAAIKKAAAYALRAVDKLADVPAAAVKCADGKGTG